MTMKLHLPIAPLSAPHPPRLAEVAHQLGLPPGLHGALLIDAVLARLGDPAVSSFLKREFGIPNRGPSLWRLNPKDSEGNPIGKPMPVGTGQCDRLVQILEPVVDRFSKDQTLRERYKRLTGLEVRTLVQAQIRPSTPPPPLVERPAENIRAAIGFTDFKKFSDACKGMPPALIAKRLNEYFELMAEVVRKRGGTIDKFIGDALMFYFAGSRDNSAQAVETAMEMQEVVKTHGRRLRTEAMKQLKESAKSTDYLQLHISKAIEKLLDLESRLASVEEAVHSLQDATEQNLSQLLKLAQLGIGEERGIPQEIMEKVSFLRELSRINHEDQLRELENARIDDSRFYPLFSEIDPLIFEMRVGVYTGDVVRLRIGGADKKDETIIGDPVNAANRLEGKARPGEVAIGEKTADDVEGRFEMTPRGLVTCKGIGPVRVFEPRRKIQIWGLVPPQEELVEFQGRVQERATLQNAFLKVKEEKKSGSVLVKGPAGIGRKRLGHEFLKWIGREYPETQVMIGHGETLSAQTPYHLIAQALRSLAKIEPDDKLLQKQMKVRGMVRRASEELDDASIEEAAGIIGFILNVPFETLSKNTVSFLKTPYGRNRIFETLNRFFRGLSDRAPVLLVLNNVHQSDADSLQVVESVTKELKDAPIMILKLGESDAAKPSTPDWEKQASAQTIELSLLENEWLGRMVDNLFSVDLEPDKKAFLIAASHGSPLLLAAIGRHNKGQATEDKNNQWKADRDPATGKPVLISPDGKQTAPDKMKEFFQARLLDQSRVSEKERGLLKMASVICTAAMDFGVAELVGLVRGSVEEANVLIRELVGKEFLAEVKGTKGRYAFPDEISRSVAYEAVVDVERFHSSYADFLASVSEDKRNGTMGTDESARIAYHLEKAKRFKEAAEKHCDMGASAMKGGSYDTAAGSYERSYRLYIKLNDPSERVVSAEALFKLLDALFYAHRYTEMKSHMTDLDNVEATLAEEDIETRAKVSRHRGACIRLSAAQAKSKDDLRRQLKLAKDEFRSGLLLFNKRKIQATPAKVQLLIVLGSFHYRHRNGNRRALAMSKGYYQRALEAATSINDDQDRGVALANLAMILVEEGNYSEAYRLGADAIEAYGKVSDEGGILEATAQAGTALMAIGDYKKALELFERGVRISRESMLGARLDQLLPNCGEAARRLGMLDSAMKYFDEAQLLFCDDAGSFMARANLMYLSLAYRDTKDWTKAMEVATRFNEIAERIEDNRDLFLSIAHMALAQIHLAQKELDDAGRESEAAIESYNRARGVPEFDTEILWTRARILHDMGAAEAALGNKASAKLYYQRALVQVEIAETQRAKQRQGLSLEQTVFFDKKPVNIMIISLKKSLSKLVKGQATVSLYVESLLSRMEQCDPPAGLGPPALNFIAPDDELKTTSSTQVELGLEEVTGKKRRKVRKTGASETRQLGAREVSLIKTNLGQVTWLSKEDRDEYAGAVISKPPSTVIRHVLSKGFETSFNRGPYPDIEAARIVWDPDTDENGNVTLRITFELTSGKYPRILGGALRLARIPQTITVRLRGRVDLSDDGILSIELDTGVAQSKLQEGIVGNDLFGKIRLYFCKTDNGGTKFSIVLGKQDFTRNAYVFIYSILNALNKLAAEGNGA